MSLRRLLPVVVIVASTALTSCGSTGRITIGDALPVDSSVVDESTTTTEPAVEEEDDTSATTTAPAGDGVTAEEDAVDVDWALNATEFRGRNGLRVAYDCPPGGTPTSLWGTETFTDDSSVCTAAAFAGLITTTDGGRVVIEIAEGLDEYAGGEANGITAQPYGTWAGSFTLVG